MSNSLFHFPCMCISNSFFKRNTLFFVRWNIMVMMLRPLQKISPFPQLCFLGVISNHPSTELISETKELWYKPKFRHFLFTAYRLFVYQFYRLYVYYYTIPLHCKAHSMHFHPALLNHNINCVLDKLKRLGWQISKQKSWEISFSTDLNSEVASANDSKR